MVGRGALWVWVAASCRDEELFLVPSDFPLVAPEPRDTAAPRGEPGPEPAWSHIQGFEAEISYESLALGEDCTARIGLRGTAYEGTCPECDFAFDIESDVFDAVGSGCEDIVPFWTWTENNIYKDPKLGFVEQYLGLQNVLWFGYALELSAYGYDYYEGPFWAIVHHDADIGHTFSFDGETMLWSAESLVEYGYGLSDYLDYTCPPGTFQPAGPLESGLAAEGDIGCDGYTMDIFEFQATEGQSIEITVDTTSTWTAFQPNLFVSDPDGCVRAYSFGAFVCRYQADYFSVCPGLSLDVAQTGTHQVIVQVLPGSCVDPEIGEYEVLVSGASGSSLSQVADDVLRYEEIRSYQVRSQMQGQLLFAD